MYRGPVTRPLLSALDLAIVSEGKTSADALAETTTLAQRADALGLTRFWVAEHHNMRTVASTSPAVLIAHLAASTDRIRVGSGGVMLPNHPPLVVAEQFAMLEALHPGRIDLGIGRAPGTDLATAAALRRSPSALGAEDFPLHLLDLMGLLGDIRTDRGLWGQFVATPVSTSTPWIGLLGSSDYSAELAGYLGLPYSYAHHFDRGPLAATVRALRDLPLGVPTLRGPRRALRDRVGERAHGLDERRGRMVRRPGAHRAARPPPGPLRADAATRSRGGASDARRGARHAVEPNHRRAREVAVERLEELAPLTHAAEVMVSTVTYGITERLASLELLADAWFS